MDYAEVVHRARLALTDSAMVERVKSSIMRIWCDDLGELDPSQVQLLADLVAAGIPLLATGDPLTSVFGFRGADQRVFEDFAAIFGADCARSHLLGANHRNPAPVRAAMAELITRIPRPTGFWPAEQPAPLMEGSTSPVEVVINDSDGAQAEYIADRLRTAHLRGGMPWDQMAVIARSSRDLLPLLARTLSNQGVPVQMAAEDVALAEAQAVRTLLGGLQAALGLASNQELDPDQVQGLLRSPLAGLDGLALRLLGRQLRTEAAELRLDVLSSAHWLSLLVSRPDELAHVSDTPAALAARDLGRLLARVGQQIAAGASASEALWALWSGTGWPERLQHAALENTDSAPRAHRDLDVVTALFDVAARDGALRGPRAIAALIAEVAGQEIPADHARESDPSARGVRLMTAHRVKGESFGLVVVAGMAEGVWPVTSRVGTLLAADRLGVSEVAPGQGWSALLAAERRLFLLALSRATDTLLVTCSVGTEGEGNQPSRFIGELGIEPRRVVGRPAHALTLTGLVAELRRTATDPGSSPGLRTAAAARLARLSLEQDARGRPLVPTADPAQWWGTKEFTRPDRALVAPGATLRLSGSELETLITCPRQWFLKRQARAENSRGSASSLGSVIHVLVDHASAEGTRSEELTEHLDRVWEQIPFDAQWLSASEREEAQAALERYDTWDRRNPRAVVGTELPFTVRLDLPQGPVELAGTVDRLEQDDQGKLHVVDFKTGRSVPTKAAAQASPQLGLYQLAAQRGAFAAQAPTATGVGGAELVYLRKDAKGSATVLGQPGLDEDPWLGDPPSDPPSAGQQAVAGSEPRNWVENLVDHAARIIRTEQFTAQPSEPACTFCPFSASCPALVDVAVGR